MSCNPTILNLVLTKTLLQTTRRVPRLMGLALLALALTSAAWADTASFTTPGTNTWTCPANVSKVIIECRGGGGAGGGAQNGASGNATAESGGGAGGSYARKTNSVSAGTTYKVIVGAGGLYLTTGLVNGAVDPTQQGGLSAFTSSDFSTTNCLAVGGAGGTSAVNLAASGTSDVTQPGGAGSTTGCIGDVLYAGGNGATGGISGNGGGGGGGAGDANPGGTATSITGAAGGLAGGGIGL
jgi:hypothetical protein